MSDCLLEDCKRKETESQDEEIIVIIKVEFMKFIEMFEDFQRKYFGDKQELNLRRLQNEKI